MVDIECTRCGAKGTGYATNYEAKFSLIHKEKCGAKIGVPLFTAGVKTTEVSTTTASDVQTVVVSGTSSDTSKPKKKKVKKKHTP